MARAKRPTTAELKKMKLVNLIRDVQSSGSGPEDSWNPAEISERLKDINFIRKLVDSWNPAELNHALQLLGFKTIESWNPAIIEEMRTSLIRIFQERTATGNPIELNLPGNLPYEIKSLTLTMNPIQEGTGDPSPSNIRPISGRDSVDVVVTGKNICPIDYIDATTSNSFILKAGTYSFSFTLKGTARYTTSNISIRDGANVLSSIIVYNKSVGERLSASFTITEEHTVAIYNANVFNDSEGKSADDIQIELGSTATSYEPYNGQTKTIAFPSTIYGGTDEVVIGTGTSTYGYIASYDGEELPGYWISDRDVYAEGTTPTTGAEVCYELATPTPFSTTPVTDLELNKGTNIISSDADDIELKYQINLS